MKIALAGNPNSGKTTLFNLLTGSNQFVGNWPGVTVEKKTGKLKGDDDVEIVDLPGVYSLSPYSLEEVVSRNFLVNEKPDAVLNIIDGTNLERNLYLTTQFLELGIPTVIAVNMMDAVRKNGDKIHTAELEKNLGCPVFEISALKNKGCMEAASATVKRALEKNTEKYPFSFDSCVEQCLSFIENLTDGNVSKEKSRWYTVKLFERDSKILEQLKENENFEFDSETLRIIESKIKTCEKEMDDDSESIITGQRYKYIESIIKSCVTKKNGKNHLSVSDKIDRIVTNKYLSLPIFAVVMWAVYYVSMVTVGAMATDWANDGLFGDGYHLFGIGSSQYQKDTDEFAEKSAILEAFENGEFKYILQDEETLELSEPVEFSETDVAEAKEIIEKYNGEEPAPENYGIWVPGIPVVIELGLDKIGCAQ